MNLAAKIAIRHLLARRRQSIVSLMGIVLGVAFFLAVSGMMQGSEKDFIRRLVDNAPHITINDEFRDPRLQPVERLYPSGAVELRNVRPLTETRGIRGFEQTLDWLRTIDGVKASPVLAGQVLVNFAGQDKSITLNGMRPAEIKGVTTIEANMTRGSVDDLIANRDGIIIGQALAKTLALNFGDNLTVAATTGQVRTFKVIGFFRTGRQSYDNSQAFVDLKRVQALLGRSNRANTIIMKVANPKDAQGLAERIEARIGYKTVSWQEASEDLMKTLAIRNTIMYTVVSAVLLVAAFGIYNVISTVVMEKHRDIAILKSMGFYAADVQKIFLIQGVLLGIAGSLAGLPLGMAFMAGLMQIRFKPPGATETINMPIDWSAPQFLIATAFAMVAAILAAFLPARKGAKVQPVDILRGGM